MNIKTVAIIQARLGSKRLPKKVLLKLGDMSVIEMLLSRLSLSKHLDEIIVAVADEPGFEELEGVVDSLGYKVFVGDSEDVLARYFHAAEHAEADVIVRITADCPFVDASIVDELILLRKSSQSDYASNVHPPTYPDGFDVEVFTFDALKIAHKFATTSNDREHVTKYLITSDGISKVNKSLGSNFSKLRLTLDYKEDYQVLKNVVARFSNLVSFNLEDVLALYRAIPALFEKNESKERNVGETMNSGQKLWERAKDVIPGGNMLLSKRAEMFLPNKWPSYFSRAKGCEVWDLDGNHFFDMSTMGVGTNTLGYGDEVVDAAVSEVIKLGNMSTLNAPEEVYLAEELLSLHPWANKVKFARTGGEANAIAVRIARAASGKDKVAICGYHGWHDWYLSANLASDKNLDGHLLPGLDALGVPRGLEGTVLPFEYNDLAALRAILSNGDVGVIKMEVVRNNEPEANFLQEVRQLATQFGAILIFDECTSGFRHNFGGLHLLHDVNPDMAVFGKTLGNGYAVTAVLGRDEIMESAQSTFISSTFWTERIGSAAGLATLSQMSKKESWLELPKIGKSVKSEWVRLAEDYEVPITLSGIDSLAGFRFNSPQHLIFKTYLTQEMLKKGFLASTSFYASCAHTDEVLGLYFEALRDVFESIGRLSKGPDFEKHLDGPVCHDGFKRLN